MLKKLEAEAPQDFAMDGTEREIIRPADKEVQRFFYSGKSKCHSIKNDLIAGIGDRQIKGLSGTHEGKKHDKKICDEEQPRLPEGSNCYDDTGFIGYEMKGVNILQPKKKPRGGELTPEDKESNRPISSVRIVIEHVISGVKRCRIVKDVFRNTQAEYDDLVMEIACALHNFRSYHRRYEY
ncbi:transposase family protein [Methylomagnum sp.]